MLHRRTRRRGRDQAAWSDDLLDGDHPLPLADAPPVPVDVASPTGTVTYVGRAPVFDRRLDVAGYHLLVDELGHGRPAVDDPAADAERSRRLLTRVLLEVGLDSLIGGKDGFLDVPIEVLADGLHVALPPHRMVLEVSGQIDDDALAVLRSVRHEGYRVVVGSLEACSHPAEAVRLTAGVRLDATIPYAEELVRQIHQWNPRSQVLVDGLTGGDETEAWRQLGATWLRGDVLRPAEQVDEPTVPLHRLAVLQLLAELERPDVDFDDIDELVSTDLGMSYKLLRMANSSYLALERRVERTRDAIVYLGIDTVRAAAALLTLSDVSDRPPEIVHISLVRARHCQEMATATHPALANAAFTTGLFSSLDTLLGMSIEQVLMRIPVADHISAALRDRSGELGHILDVAMAYEDGDLDRLHQLRADPTTTVFAYRHALRWMANLHRGLYGTPHSHQAS
jgi:c-di-GMP phosphodiesterase